MNRKINLGTFPATGKPFEADLDIILRSNVLAQANSGGGKSWLLRRMIEQIFGKVPQIVIDPEGEFATLRKKFDFVLVGQGGDTPADVRSAPLLATRLLELGASAVIDLYEMDVEQRPAWVAAFVNALIRAPKKLWRNLLVYVDEAHEMAPEPGHGVSDSPAEKACRSALIGLGSKGRKRGYGLVCATQRLGKLSKDVAAELKNTLIGQTWIDIDGERAAGSLGIAKANKTDFIRDVKTIEPGNFFVLGRAFALEPTRVHIDPVQTEHPQAGIRQSAPPPPTDKIRHLLPQLADLPKEAEQKIKTETELRAEIALLRRELGAKPNSVPGPERRVEVPVVPAEWVDTVKLVLASLIRSKDEVLSVLAREMDDAGAQIGQLVRLGGKFVPMSRVSAPSRPLTTKSVLHKNPVSRPDVQADGGSLVRGEREILNTLAFRHPERLSRGTMALLSCMADSGTLSNYIASLVGRGYVTREGGFGITDAGLVANGPIRLIDRAELVARWRGKMVGKTKDIMDLFTRQHGPFERSAVADQVGMSDSGTLSNYLSDLKRAGIIEKTSRGFVVNQELAL